MLLVIGVIALIYAAAFAYYGISLNIVTDAKGMIHAETPALIGVLLGIAPILFAILVFSYWISALVDMLKNTAIQGSDKIVWTLVIIFLNILGAIIYFFVAPRPKLRLNLSAPSHAPHSP